MLSVQSLLGTAYGRHAYRQQMLPVLRAFYDRDMDLGFGPVKTGRDSRHNTASVPGMAGKAGAAGGGGATGGAGIPWPGARSGTWNTRILDDILPQLEISEEALNWALSLHSDQAPGDRAFDLIASHCAIVALLTQRICKSIAGGSAAGHSTARRDAAGHGAHGQDTAGRSTGGYGTATDPSRPVDLPLAVLGALVHDIGTYQVIDDPGSYGGREADPAHPVTFRRDYIRHGILGYTYLRDSGADEAVAQFARNHTGLGLTRDMVERQHLDLPAADYVPLTREQEIVMYADKFNSKSDPIVFVSVEGYSRRCARFGEANVRRWHELVDRYGAPDIRSMAENYGLEVE